MNISGGSPRRPNRFWTSNVIEGCPEIRLISFKFLGDSLKPYIKVWGKLLGIHRPGFSGKIPLIKTSIFFAVSPCLKRKEEEERKREREREREREEFWLREGSFSIIIFNRRPPSSSLPLPLSLFLFSFFLSLFFSFLILSLFVSLCLSLSLFFSLFLSFFFPSLSFFFTLPLLCLPPLSTTPSSLFPSFPPLPLPTSLPATTPLPLPPFPLFGEKERGKGRRRRTRIGSNGVGGGERRGNIREKTQKFGWCEEVGEEEGERRIGIRKEKEKKREKKKKTE